jgi:aspartate-semialdehyde dehydrogenase
VPEINAKDIKKHKGIIANPNCSTIQMVLCIWPIYKKVGIKRVIVCTYQAASGAGRGAIEQLREELRELSKSEYQNIKISEYQEQRVLPQQLAFNVIPHIGDFGDFDYTSEEQKMVLETHKILHDDRIKITATCVRVPVRTAHSQAIYLETKRRISPE